MKRLICILNLLLFAYNCHAADSLPTEITINQVVHYKISQGRDQTKEYIIYVPKGQSLMLWSSLAAIYYYIFPENPLLFAQTISNLLVEDKAGKSLMIESINNNPNDVLQVYYFTNRTNKIFTLEKNAWRYKKREGHNGIISVLYATRKYYKAENIKAGEVFDVEIYDKDILEDIKKLPLDSYRFDEP